MLVLVWLCYHCTKLDVDPRKNICSYAGANGDLNKPDQAIVVVPYANILEPNVDIVAFLVVVN